MKTALHRERLTPYSRKLRSVVRRPVTYVETLSPCRMVDDFSDYSDISSDEEDAPATKYSPKYDSEGDEYSDGYSEEVHEKDPDWGCSSESAESSSEEESESGSDETASSSSSEEEEDGDDEGNGELNELLLDRLSRLPKDAQDRLKSSLEKYISSVEGLN